MFNDFTVAKMWRFFCWCVIHFYKMKKKDLAFRLAFILLFFFCTRGVSQAHFPVPKKERISEITRFISKEPKGLGHPISNRTYWDNLAKNKEAALLIDKAVILLDAAPLPVNKEQWMAYVDGKTERDNYEKPFLEQGQRFCNLVMAEALEDKGRFMPAIEKMLQEILVLGTWKKPQSDGKVDKDYWYGKKFYIDLTVASRSFNIATADFWLQDRLKPETRKALRAYIQKNVFDPYLALVNTPNEEYAWMLKGQNWNAVCTAGVVGACLSLSGNVNEKATMLAASETAMKYFLSGFKDDGYCTEGVNYWGYGFSHFLALNQIVKLNTDGNINWLKQPKVAKASIFPANVEILNGFYPSFSDARVYVTPKFWISDFAKEKLGLVKNRIAYWQIQKLAEGDNLYFQGMLQTSKTEITDKFEKMLTEDKATSIRSFFPDGGLLVCRPTDNNPKGMAVSLKGGNNAEHHNHNDLGTFEVVLGNQKMVVDPGSEWYNKKTFDENRYASDMMNSFGHCTPMVANTLQSAGSDAKAIIIYTDFSPAKDEIAFDLSSAYKVPGLLKLNRTFTYNRSKKMELIVSDEVEFSQAESFGTALILDTYNASRKMASATWKITGKNKWEITKGEERLSVEVTSLGNEIVMKEQPLKAHRLDETYHPVRLGFSLKENVKSAKIIMKIKPI